MHANGVEGNWNENAGGASKTERPATMWTILTIVPRIFDQSRMLEGPIIRAQFQRLVRRSYFTKDQLFINESVFPVYSITLDFSILSLDIE